MLPLILVAVGTYLIGDSILEDKKYAKGGKTEEKLAEYLVTLTNEDGFEDDVVVMAKSEDDALYQAEKIKGYESNENGVVMLTDFDGKKIEYKKGGKTQGYDDKEDERLAMKRGKMSKKDLDSTHARRDDARFEERGKMAKGGKLVGKQKKLDVNKNGKLDAEDFKMLRGEKMAKGGKLKINGDDFSFLLDLTDKELSKKLDLIRKQQDINGKQYLAAKEKNESTKKFEDSRKNLDNQERAIIEARARKMAK